MLLSSVESWDTKVLINVALLMHAYYVPTPYMEDIVWLLKPLYWLAKTQFRGEL